mmetsp:Transcript_54804/g.61307  ORF Transcript_54804/g.61307 Transcript_54804/m.61307 type:complete len:120 (-) Transcript_54804:3216-3575(-)
MRMNKQVITNNAATDLGTEVILKGTEGEPTSEDMDFIGKALVASYNNVHWEVGHYLSGEHAVDFMGPDSILCNHCPDDDSMGGAFMTKVLSRSWNQQSKNISIVVRDTIFKLFKLLIII